jgi:uncharacterized membrane protein
MRAPLCHNPRRGARVTNIQPSFIAVELLVFALFAWAVVTALKSARTDLITLIAACLFGFVIEYLFSTPFDQMPHWLQRLLWSERNASGDSYAYGKFLVMVAGVPIWISLGWGTIIYAALRTSERLGFPFWLVPISDGLLAVSLDLALDPVAEALGYWHWTLDKNVHGLATMFGVPLDNFLGWFMIVGGLSLTIRIAWRAAAHYGNALWAELSFAVVAVAVALGFALALQAFFDFLYARITPAGAFMLIFGIGGLVTVSQLPWLRRDQPLDGFALGIVAAMHVFLLFMSIAHGIFRDLPALLGFQPLLAAASMLAFVWPSLERIRVAARARELRAAT